MNPDSPNKNFEFSEEKASKLTEIRDRVEKIKDGLGRPIDPEIKDTIVYLKALDLDTWQSCGGHWEEDGEDRCDAPYVIFEAPNKPEHTYEDEAQIIQQMMDKHGVTSEQIDLQEKEARPAIKDISAEILNRGNVRTSEYEEWDIRNMKMFTKLQQLLEEFYTDRNVPPETKLIIGNKTLFRLTNQAGVYEDQYGDSYLRDVTEIPVDSNMDVNKEKVVAWQAEMQAFTEFLKEKFLEQ